MSAPRHAPSLLAQFQDGERCLVWARRKDDGTLYYLEDGTANEIREWAKTHLECLIPDCPDPRLVTVARAYKRDGFSHYAGAGGHSDVSEFHAQGEAALQAWVQATLGPAGVTAVCERGTPNRERIADVRVTWPDGARVALEVQYAAQSVAEWRERHESYRRQGIVDVWLLGHTKPHLSPTRGRNAADTVDLHDLHKAMREDGVPLLWINPLRGLIGTVSVAASAYQGRTGRYDDGWDDRSVPVPPSPAADQASLHLDQLTGCALTPAGLSVPALTRLRSNARELAAVDDARRAADEALEAAERRRAERAAAQAQAQATWAQQERDQQQQAWNDSPLRADLLARHNGVAPTLLTVTLNAQDGICTSPEHWQAVIYEHHIRAKPGSSFTFDDAFAALGAEGIPTDRCPGSQRTRAVRQWLQHLAQHHVVALHHDDPRKT